MMNDGNNKFSGILKKERKKKKRTSILEKTITTMTDAITHKTYIGLEIIWNDTFIQNNDPVKGT